MEGASALGQRASRLDRAIAFARTRPGGALAIVLGIHLVVWTVLPMLVCPNLQLDLVEDLALGREWQLGYWKHPPLPWWTADLIYRLTGEPRSVYLLGPLAAVACMYFVWRLAREVVGPTEALVSVLALEGLHFFNFSVVKFAHDQMQLPFWALTGWVFYRAIIGGRMRDWVWSGAFLALAFWSKYAAFALAATLGLFLLLDPLARRAWRTAGPYAMAAAFLVVLAPNLWWLAEHGFQPFRYVGSRAAEATQLYQYLWFPLRWSAGQIFYLVPLLALLAVLLRGATLAAARDETALARRYVTALALGPFAFTTLAGILAGRLPVAMWGYPLWCFAPLAIVMWYPPRTEPQRMQRFALGFLAIFIAMPLAYAADESLEPLFRDRPKATQFPGRLLAETVTRQWRERTGAPLRYVVGAEVPPRPDERQDMGPTALGEFPANNVAVYSPDRPRILVRGDPAISPWIDMDDFQHRGGVVVWLRRSAADPIPANLHRNFPHAELQPDLVLPRQTLIPRAPVIVGIAFIPPRR